MKINNTTRIIDDFAKVQSMTDLLFILNYVKRDLYGAKANPFSLKQFNYYTITKTKYTQYHVREIPKKTGGVRIIHSPVKGLKHLQACLNCVLQAIYQPHKAATGFVPGKSIVDNALQHTRKGYVLNIDLKDFFPTIERERIWGCLLFPPFNLGNTSVRRQIANRISILCTAPMKSTNEQGIEIEKFVLPQGAPTSPTLTNIIANRLDRRLQGVAKRYHLTYTRYADDITFSANINIFKESGEVMTEIRRVINDQNFVINEKKLRQQQHGYRQEVTGLIVNEKVNVHRRYVKQLRQWLYLWETYGYRKACGYFLKDYAGDKGHVKDILPDMVCVIGGKLDFLKMVKGENDPVYVKLNERYIALNKMQPVFSRGDIVAGTLEKLATTGLDDAMKYYTKYT